MKKLILFICFKIFLFSIIYGQSIRVSLYGGQIYNHFQRANFYISDQNDNYYPNLLYGFDFKFEESKFSIKTGYYSNKIYKRI